MKRLAPLMIGLPAAFVLSGCLGQLILPLCESFPFGELDADHCIQMVAVQESWPALCEDIEGEGFVGQNPPKDKCYLQIAENTGDPTVCEKIVGGITSYTVDECLKSVFTQHTPDSCKDAAQQVPCRTAYAKNGKGCGEGYALNASTKTCEKSAQ